ncbi:4-hydroxy-tetrahydrodipicolinate synthase [Aquimarina sp. ERC-38]|uniref:4-hydroxy-tetrahydrodipicolinate synthase n=1 Tax=Aquimarina sp. ERC-38 TaxID=2949996 RepID=UPI002247E8D3|nr:4-hydroxy-tetrahydrodipicolinate synthase [Aquimarina sp. ERC-38]UZO79364.1 4-hydroxy-tetrahydrodipicolinate synthase [Aquimarina sp. ERC-38]
MKGFLQGTGVALVTPFSSDLSIDYPALTNLIEYNIARNVDYLVVMGTTAESATLSKPEKKEVIAHIRKVNSNRVPMVLGIGGNNTEQVLQEIEETDLADFSAILSVVPMYNKPTQEGIYQHYKKIAEYAPLPILLYNVPSRTGTNMEADTTLRLSSLTNIIGIKEATSDIGQVLAILKDRPEDFLVISGDDMLALSLVAAGGDGVISVVGQGFPKQFSELISNGIEGDLANSYEQLFQLLPAINYAFEEGNPAGIKSILAAKDICKPYVRLPLVKASKKLETTIKEFVNRLPVQ